MSRRGFSLLEVMVAVAILGLSLTVILSAQVGLFSSGSYNQQMSQALGLGRCKMGELEEQFLKMGLPEIDNTEEGACCNNEARPDFSCVWKIERIELPQPSVTDPLSSLASAAGGLGGPPGSGGPAGGLGALGALAQAGGTFGPSPTGSLDLGSTAASLAPGGPAGLSGMLASGAAQGGVNALAPMLFSMVYPSIKPMLEASIRRVTVTVVWRQGLTRRELELLQWVTSPTRGGFLSDAIDSASLSNFPMGGGPTPGAPGAPGLGTPGGFGGPSMRGGR